MLLIFSLYNTEAYTRDERLREMDKGNTIGIAGRNCLGVSTLVLPDLIKT